MTNSTSLASSSASVNIHGYINIFCHINSGKRTDGHFLLLLGLAVVGKLTLVDGEDTSTLSDSYTSCTSLSAASGEKFFGV